MDEDQVVVEEELVLRVVNAGRRRRNRRIALIATTVLVAAGLVAGVIAVFATAPRENGARADAAGSSRVVHPGTPQPVSDQAQIYAAALREASPSGADIYVRALTCDSAAQRPASDDCVDARIPDQVQQELDALVASDLSFVEGNVTPVGVDDPPLVIFGALEQSGATAKLGFEFMCGPLCGQGETLVLTEQPDGRWQVTGREGPAWIS
jgi:hypothetical protein